MKEIKIFANCAAEDIIQLHGLLGGTISERWGEQVLEIDNEIAKGCIKFMTLDWGVSLTEFNLIFFEEVLKISNTSEYNPIHFTYCSKGFFQHRFYENQEYTTVQEFHSSILVAKEGDSHYTIFPKGVHLEINNISILRKEFLKKRLNSVETLNQKLYKVFVGESSENEFSYYGPIHVRMEDHVNKLRNLDSEGLIRILQIEGEVYQLLSMHIEQHDRLHHLECNPTTLLKNELKIIRRFAQKIIDDPSKNYSLDFLSKQSGLSQAKLQDGFKYLYTRTVTEYIRHTRIEAARDLMSTTDMNISQIVYSIGFTSRSYFSKIFKEKYGLTPHEFKNKIVLMEEVEN